MSVSGYVFPGFTETQAGCYNYLCQDNGTEFRRVMLNGKTEYILVGSLRETLQSDMEALCVLLNQPKKTFVTIHGPSKFVEY
jgi:hypothetical protein